MSLLSAATDQIQKYGFKGAAFLLKFTDGYSKATKKTTGTESPRSLYAYVNGYDSSKVNDTTILASDRRILISLDSDFDGVIGSGDRIRVNGEDLTIVRQIPYRIKDSIAYVEVQARG